MGALFVFLSVEAGLPPPVRISRLLGQILFLALSLSEKDRRRLTVRTLPRLRRVLLGLLP
jgi:hypothetical protein